MYVTLEDALPRVGAVADDAAAGVRGASPCRGCCSGALTYSHHQQNQVRHPRRRVESPQTDPYQGGLHAGTPRSHPAITRPTGLPKIFPTGAVDAASGKAMRSGFGLLSCGGSGFPAHGEEVKGLVLHVLEARSLFGRLFTCEKL